ncbi:MAG: hypothetical protein CMP10_10070, partial [Zetaproteobacteria bacterium]|nr:hypothetical protein [Pseudobdellovibrionaceae bacterium]
MRKFLVKKLLITSTIIGLSPGTMAQLNRYSQIIVPFEEPKTYRYDYNKITNTIQIEIENATPEQLSQFDIYDETLIRRVSIKELSGQGVQIMLTLKDENVRATVSQFNQPWRLAIDLFDKDFREHRDLATGFPLATRTQPAVPSQPSQHAPWIMEKHSTNNRLQQPTAERPPQPYNNPYSPGNNKQGIKRRLLQPVPDDIQRPDQLISAIEKMNPGKGKFWKEFPTYIYRIQTS